jgi:hypothetical protein
MLSQGGGGLADCCAGPVHLKCSAGEFNGRIPRAGLEVAALRQLGQGDGLGQSFEPLGWQVGGAQARDPSVGIGGHYYVVQRVFCFIRQRPNIRPIVNMI